MIGFGGPYTMDNVFELIGAPSQSPASAPQRSLFEELEHIQEVLGDLPSESVSVVDDIEKLALP